MTCQTWKSSFEEGNYQSSNLDTNDHELLRLPVSLILQMSQEVLSRKNQKVVLSYHKPNPHICSVKQVHCLLLLF